jgi:RimJ/RimL family protein N-acetyltransferase
VHFVQFDPESDRSIMCAVHEMWASARPTDHPSMPPQSLEAFTGWWSHGVTSRKSWVCLDDSGEPAGCYLLTLPDRENADSAGCGLMVSPQRRRGAVGSRLLAHCANQARLAGRTKITSTGSTRTKVRDGSPGTAFAVAAGASLGITELIRIQDIGPDRLGGLEGSRAAAERRAEGYELLCWCGLSPDGYLDQIARVHSAMADAPRDAGVQPSSWDASRVRSAELAQADQGLRCYSVAAVHRASAEFAALTQILTDPRTPGWAVQDITAVLPRHRGRRLGLLVKIAMLDYLTACEPGIRRVVTGNAESNEHMNAINAQLGYRVSDVYRSWELRIGRQVSVPPTAAG